MCKLQAMINGTIMRMSEASYLAESWHHTMCKMYKNAVPYVEVQSAYKISDMYAKECQSCYKMLKQLAAIQRRERNG